MSSDESKPGECESPGRSLQTEWDAQQMAPVEETTQQTCASNPVQLEFLNFLKSLDEQPPEIGDVSNGDDHMSFDEHATRSELETDLITNQSSLITEGSNNLLDESLLPQDQEQEQEQELSELPQLQQMQELQKTFLKYNFTHKLHLAASSEQVAFISWSADGQLLQLDYIGLQEHLCSAYSMFRSRTVIQLVRKILKLGFERMPDPEQELNLWPQLYFHHAFFVSGQPELLLLLPTPQPLMSNTSVLSGQEADELQSGRDMFSQSPLHLARCRFHTLLNYHNDVQLLQEHEPNADLLVPRRGRISSTRQPMQSLPAPLAAKHINPRDSVLQFQTGQVPEYAGFYGDVEPSLINEFFAEFLPRYGARTTGYKDVVVDGSKANTFQQNLPIGVMYSDDEDYTVDPENQVAATSPARTSNEFLLEDGSNTLPEDIELEQVMQELCGINVEGEEVLMQKEQSPPQPKQKRKKPARKSAITNAELDPDSLHEVSGEHILQAYVNIEQDTIGGIVNYQIHVEKDNSQLDSKSTRKRRRYDLRNSKPKRSR